MNKLESYHMAYPPEQHILCYFKSNDLFLC